MISKYKVEALRSSGSKQLEDYISAFDQEIRAKDSLTKKAEEEISRLRVELYRANAAADSARNGILIPGKELPFFSGEIRNVVIKALNKARNQFFDKGRAQNIIDDLIRTNIKSDEEEKIEEGIKSILSSAKDLGRRERRALEHIGFSFNDTGRHIEATYHNDPRYSFTISKTSSDTRGMKNQISDICKTLFQ
jgi:vacuolar-type H+-ATPase subunit I/STV1